MRRINYFVAKSCQKTEKGSSIGSSLEGELPERKVFPDSCQWKTFPVAVSVINRGWE